MSQIQYSIMVLDANEHHLPNAQVRVEQEGISLPVETRPLHERCFSVQIIPHVPAKVSAKLEGYVIQPLEVANPNRVENLVILSAGRPEDSLVFKMGRPVYFKAFPDLIGFYPTPKFHQLAREGKLDTWAESLGLVPAETHPWPEDPLEPISFGAFNNYPVFYQRSDGKPFPRHHVAQLDSIRASGMGMDAGVPLQPYIFLTNIFWAASCTAPAEWLSKHQLIVTPDPVTQGRTFSIEGPKDLGYGALDMLQLLRESGYFEGVEPYFSVMRVQNDE